MCREHAVRRAVLARNDEGARALRAELTARGTTTVNLMSSPGSGKTALLQAVLRLARARGVPVAALTADLATENDARRLAEAGAPVRQILTDGLCHLEAGALRRHIEGWLPPDTALLFVENVGNLVCPASYDLGETMRVALMSVTEGEDKPLKYPAAFGLAHLVVVTKDDLAAAAGFDAAGFAANVARVNPGVEILATSARTGLGVADLLARCLAARHGGPAHVPVMARDGGARGVRCHDDHDHGNDHDHGHDHDHGNDHGHGHDQDHGHDQHHDRGHDDAGGPRHGRGNDADHDPAPRHDRAPAAETPGTRTAVPAGDRP